MISENKRTVHLIARLPQRGPLERTRLEPKLSEAREIWNSIIELYGDAPTTKKEVESVRRLLDEKVSSSQGKN